METVPDEIRELAKVELHLHLDCCLSFAAARQLEPGLTAGRFADEFTAPRRLDGLPAFLARTARHLDLLQTPEALTLCVEDVFGQLAADNVRYAELRFAPHQHRRRGMDLDLVVDTVAGAVRAGNAGGPVTGRVILCGLWGDPPEHSREILRLVRQRRSPDRVVVAMDVAGHEAHPNRGGHLGVLAEAAAAGVPFTVHAGEGLGPGAVLEVLDRLSPARVGHGVRASEDPALVARLAAAGTHLEICPSCNVQLGLYPGFGAHPVGALARAGVSVGISTDQRTITQTDLGTEYARLRAADPYWTVEALRAANRKALLASFADAATRERISSLV
jgi:adenosine deaminase